MPFNEKGEWSYNPKDPFRPVDNTDRKRQEGLVNKTFDPKLVGEDMAKQNREIMRGVDKVVDFDTRVQGRRRLPSRGK